MRAVPGDHLHGSNLAGWSMGRNRSTGRIAIAFLVFFAHLSWGFPSQEAAFDYARTLWHVSDGLPEDTIQAIAESTDNQLWIGTTGGLVRFDGAHMQISGSGPTGNLPVNGIFCLRLGHDGTVWAGTEGGGVLHIDAKGWQVYSGTAGLENGFVRSLLQDSHGRLWVGTDNGLFLREGERFKRINVGTPEVPLAVHDILEDRNHHIWVGGSRLYSLDSDGNATQYILSGAYNDSRVRTMLQTADGTIWIGTGGGMQKLVGDRFEKVQTLHAAVRSLLQSSDGTLWIGTIGKGLWTIREGHLSRTDSPGLLPSENVLKIFEDTTHQIWIGTQAGLVRLSRTMIHFVPFPLAGSLTSIDAISSGIASAVDLAAGHLYKIEGETLHPINLAKVGASVRIAFRASDKSFWIGTDGKGAYRFQDRKTIHIKLPGGLADKSVRAFLETRHGEIWIATDEGVDRIWTGGIEKFDESAGLAYFSARSLLEDREGNIWIGTDHGLSRWIDGHFVKDSVTNALSEEKVWSILQDRSGVLWFGTRDHGLFRYSHGNLERFTTLQGLPTNSIFGIIQDRDGIFWITGSNTIAAMFESEMDGSTASSRSPLNARVFRMPFTAEGAQLYGGWQPVGYATADGSMWFPTSRGVARVHMPRKSSLSLPRIQINSVDEDAVEKPLTNDLEVPARVNRLSLAFFAASLQPEDRVRFRWKLDGFDRDWSAAEPSRIVTYTNLPPGHYRFRVSAFDPARPGLATEADIALVKEPYFYETLWFYLMCAIAVVGIAYILYETRIRQIKKRFAAVLAERERVAREMHDTVIQGCAGISALLEALVSSEARESSESPRHELLNHVRQQARCTIDEARQAVWNLRHHPERELDLIEALRGVVTQTMREGRNSVQVQHNVACLTMNARAATEILMTVREAICNAMRHSGSETIIVDLRSSKEELKLSIRDYGCGIREDRLSTQKMHYGIAGMGERMRRIGGGVQIDGMPGSGTTVHLQLQWGKMRKMSTRL